MNKKIMVGIDSSGNKIKRLPGSQSPRWVNDEQNNELLFFTLNQSSANVQSVILRPNEINWEETVVSTVG